MICYNCKSKFYIKRNFLSLFDTQKYYICDACTKAYPIRLQYQEIPLENYILNIISIFDFTYRLCLEAYSKEISKVISFFLKKHKDCFFIFLEHFVLTDSLVEQVSFLADVEKKHILLICCDVKK